MHHYFTGLDFRWCGSTSYESRSVRIKSNRQVPKMNRLSLGVLDMDVVFKSKIL